MLAILKKFKLNLTAYILLAMVIGIVYGMFVHTTYAKEEAINLSDNISIFTEIFMRLIKMIIAPLIITTLSVGIAKIGDMQMVGRVGLKILIWFIIASIISLIIGMVVMNITELGTSLNLTLPASDVKTGISGSAMTLKSFIIHMFPKSIAEAMANNEILQILVASLFFGFGMTAIGPKAAPLISLMDTAAHVILKITGYVMWIAPLASFAAMFNVVAINGLDILFTYLKLYVTFLASLSLLWILITLVGFVFLRKRVFELLKRIFDCFLLAFSTASSESAFPQLIKELEGFGCDSKIVSFALPLGYSFNLDGSMMYTTFASLFIAQAYGIHLSFTEQITMLAFMMITSKGMAGTPRASLVVVASCLSAFHIPEVGIALIIGVDQVFDMARSGTNLIGNSVAIASICKIENKLSDPVQVD